MRDSLAAHPLLPGEKLVRCGADVPGPLRSSYASDFRFGDRVHIDSDTTLTAIITGLLWRSTGEHTIEASWLHNGSSLSAWFGRDRLTPSQKSRADG